ncbi:MAG: branched-chain amino acid ABC transporter permease, partial [Desulfatiglandales bacterium]
TMGFGVAVYQTFVNSETLSGGRMGLLIKKLTPVFSLPPTNFNYYFNLFMAAIFLLLTYNIVSSYMGRAFVAIRDNDIAAEVTGVNLVRYKLLAFFISSFYTGIQGGLYALFMGYVEPNMFTFMESITMFVAVIVGGLSSVEGAILGAAFIVIVPQFLSQYKGLVPVVYGLTIMLILIFEPMGLYGRWMKIRLYFRNWPFR